MACSIRWTALLALIVIAGMRELRAQTVRLGVVDDPARSELRAAWSDDSTQDERGYCVQRARISSKPELGGGTDSIFRVIAVVPATTTSQDPNHAAFECAPGTPELHTHTPATCLTDDVQYCHADGPLAFSCQPSRSDYKELIERHDQFAVIQCDRRAFRFYFPSDYVVPVPKPPTSVSPQ